MKSGISERFLGILKTEVNRNFYSSSCTKGKTNAIKNVLSVQL